MNLGDVNQGDREIIYLPVGKEKRRELRKLW